MVMVQEDASYAGMPHSAIQTGSVDYVLPASAMPAQLIAYVQGLSRARHLSVCPPVMAQAFDFSMDAAFDGRAGSERTGNWLGHSMKSETGRAWTRRRRAVLVPM